MGGEIILEEQVDRIRVLAAGRGKMRAARLEVDGFGPGEGDSFVPFRALIDPGAEQTDLLGCEPRAFFGHKAVGIETHDEFNEVAISAVAGDKGRTRFATFEDGFAGIEAKIAFGATTPVAFNATGFEDGFDFFAKIDLVTGRRRKLRSLLR